MKLKRHELTTSGNNAMLEYLLLANKKAWEYQGLTYPNPPVGALITDVRGDIIATGAHEYAGGPHAEVNAIRSAYSYLSNDDSIKEENNASKLHEYIKKRHNKLFENCSIYVTLEPCAHRGKTPPCSSLIKELNFKNVYIGILDENKNAAGGLQELKKAGLHVEVAQEPKPFQTLITPFLKLQQKKPFVFFKLAMSANGVITGGTISSEASRKHMHKLRDKVDLLIIGGNTVREDRPRLDARLCSGKAPDVLIYSNSSDFDMTIPLFDVPNRKVYIEKSLKKISEYSFVMIEGGEGMLNACTSFVDWYLVYQSPHKKEGKAICWPIKKEILFSQKINEDTLTWYKKSV